jgi:hypothetical protein
MSVSSIANIWKTGQLTVEESRRVNAGPWLHPGDVPSLLERSTLGEGRCQTDNVERGEKHVGPDA